MVNLTQRASKGRKIRVEKIQEKSRDVEAEMGMPHHSFEGFCDKENRTTGL